MSDQAKDLANSWPFPRPVQEPDYTPKKQDSSYQTFPYAGNTGSRGPMHAAKAGVPYPQDWISAATAGVTSALDGPQAYVFEDIVKSSQVAAQGGRKFDGGKLEYGLMPPEALEENVKVLTFGAQKYERDNWKRVPDGKRRYFDAALRHLWAFKRGEEFDPETNLHHLAHALCCIEFILDLELNPTPENPK